MRREWMNFSAEMGAFRKIYNCACIATVKYCAKHWMKVEVEYWEVFLAADTNQALSRHPFDHALDSPFLPETLLLVLSTEL